MGGGGVVEPSSSFMVTKLHNSNSGLQLLINENIYSTTSRRFSPNIESSAYIHSHYIVFCALFFRPSFFSFLLFLIFFFNSSLC